MNLALTLMLMIFITQSAWSAGYTFTLSGRDLYEVVLDTKDSADQLKPGIYKISPKNGDLEPAILGEVNWVNRAYKGILSHVNLQSSAAQDSLSVVNNELVLFNFNSSPQRKNSALRFGGKSQGRIQVIDTLSGRPLELPPINNREDIQIFEGPILGVSSGLPRGGRVYLVSVKAPSILGSGLTFGFVLPASSEKESARVLHDRAFLLSYDFLLQNELARLVAFSEDKAKDGLIVSPLQIQSVRTGLESRLHIGALRRLDAHLARFLKFTQELTPNLNSRDVSHIYYGLPAFDLVDGVSVQQAVPVEQISGAEDRTAGIAEVYDPATQRYALIDWSEGSKHSKVVNLNLKTSLTLIPSDKVEGLAFAQNSIDRNPKSGRPYIYGVKQISLPSAESKEIDITERFSDGFVYFSNSDLHLGIRQSSFNQDGLQSIRLSEIKANPGDRIEMVRFSAVEDNDRKYHTFLISRQGAKAQKAQVYSLVFEETSSIRLIRAEQIFEGPFLSAAELKLRSVEDGEPLFDNVTRSSGVRNYLSSAKTSNTADDKLDLGDDHVTLSVTDMTRRTVPYHRLFHGLKIAEKSHHMGSQRYVLPLSSNQLVPNQLFYEEYDERGAKVAATGFYLKKDGEKPSFLPGYPLFKSIDKQSKEMKLISDSAALTFDNGSAASHPAVHLHLFPLSRTPIQKGKRASTGEMPQRKSGATSSFELGVGLTSPGWHGGSVKGYLGGVQINLPYGSLSFTKIIQGTKANVDTFHVLLFFNENPKVPGSSNAVIAVSGRILKSSLLKNQIDVTMTTERPVHLHKGIVSANDYKAHLKVDAEGAFYWDEDPSMPYDSQKKKVRKLGTTEFVTARSRTMSALRDPDFIKESEVGMTQAGLRLGGHWQIHSRDGLRSHIPGVSELFDKEKEQTSKNKEEDEKASSKAPQAAGKQPNVIGEKYLMKAFEEYLDSLYQTNRAEEKVRVIMVEPDFEPMFREAFFKMLGRTTGNAPFSLKNSNLRFFYAQENLDDVEVAHELRFIASPNRRTRNVLYIEPEHFMNQKIVSRSALDADGEDESLDNGYLGPEGEDDARDPVKVFKHDDIDSPANLLALLASAGQVKTAAGLKKVTHASPSVPTFILTTPDKWRQVIASKHNLPAVQAGALDKFEINHDFLTSSWSVWPPGSAKASEEVNGLEKATYNSEEMKVFPTLDHILTQASQGQLKGKQVILVVPPELKPVIQKLIVLRWSTQDVQNALPWTHANRKLAIFRVSSKDANQAQLQDNFRSIWGASTSRHAVIYGDLETVERIGRPVNPSGKTFVLRDPIKAREDLLDEAAGPIVKEASQGEDSSVADTSPWPFGSKPEKAASVTEMSEERKHALAVAIRNAIAELTDQIEAVNAELTVLDAKLGEHEIDRDRYDNEYSDKKMEMDELEQKRLARLRTLQGLEGSLISESEKSEGNQLIPHALWWIASEGQLVQPGRGKEWNLTESVERKAATILIGTEEELARLEADMSAEGKFFSAREHFEVVRLAPPDEETRFELVKGLFERPEVAALGLRFNLENNNGRDPKSQLIYHFFNRVDQIAYDIKLEKTTAFVKAFTALKNAIAEDPNVRRSRQIDEKFMERLFTKVFPMPLNEDILEESDPLRMARNVDSAVRGLQKAGYEGSQDLKRRVIENMLSQTRPTDSSRPIPNSQIFFGKTSKGKTYLIQTLFKWLGLVEYNPNRASNVDADYIFINVAKLTHDQSVDPDKTPVGKVIEQIMDLLVQPKGPRAHIVFDDFHKAVSKEVRVALFQFIQGLFEARNGMITVRSRDGKKVREIPVQNLNLYMTLNPATSEKARAEYIRSGALYSQAELLKREVLAAIADQGFKPEESVLARWADIVNIDSFPRSAKVPELGKRVRQHSRTSREMIMVEPKVIDSLVGRFEEANARELLAPAAAALTNIPSSATPARLYLVSLREVTSNPYALGSDLGPINLHHLNSIVRQMTQIDPVQYSDPKSMMKFMGLLLQNFRLQLYNNLILEAHMSDALRLNLPGTVNLLKSQFLLGTATHIIDHPEIPTREMVIRPEQLSFFTRGQTHEFYAQFRRLISSQPYFPAALAQREEHSADLEEFVNGQSGLKAHPRTRRDVIHEYVDRLRAELLRFMAIYLRLQDPESIHQMGRWGDAQIRGWFNDLKEENPDVQIRDSMIRILDVFLDFQVAFNSPDVIDSHETNENNQTIVSLFDEVRLFGFMMDKAITTLPWGHVSRFTYEVTQLASDLSLGQKTAFKEYIGNHDLSPFAITTPEFMQDMVEVSRTMAQSPFSLDDLRQGFVGVCASLLGPKKGGGQ